MKNLFEAKFTLGTVIQLIYVSALAWGAYVKYDARLAATEHLNAVTTEILSKHQDELNRHRDDLVRLKTLIEERHRPPPPKI